MNDAANTFNQTNRERSVTARGARHKRGGSRSKKCTLPSDHLTPAQRKEMNGNVETYKMNAPHTLKELKKWPADLRHEYMEGLLERYAPSNKDLSSMLGYSAANISGALIRYFGIKRDRSWTPARGLDAINEWSKFLEVAPKTEPEPAPDPEPVLFDEPVVETEPVAKPRPLILDRIEIRFTGTVQDLITMVQAGALKPADGVSYTLSLFAERRED